MKHLFLTSLFFALSFHSIAHAQTAKNVLVVEDYEAPYFAASKTADPGTLRPGQTVLFFINLNLNPKEANALKQVAHKTGQSVVSFPDDQLMIKLQPIYLDYAKASNLAHRLYTEAGALRAQAAQELNAERKLQLEAWVKQKETEAEQINEVREPALKDKAFTTALQHYHQKIDPQLGLEEQADAAYQKALQQLIAQLSQNQAKVTTLVISGHHGEYFYGDLTVNFNNASDEEGSDSSLFYTWLRPITQNVTAIALWACDSVNPEYAEEWLKLAPRFEIMLGYSDSAPLGSRPSSSAFLMSGLLARTRLNSAKTTKELKTLFLALPGVAESAAALVLRNPALGAWMMSSSIVNENNQLKIERKLVDLNEEFRCASVQSDIEATMALMKPYVEGEKELPADETLSPVKRAYFYLHHHASCYSADQTRLYSAYQIGLLRFFETAVKFNIAKNLEAKIKAAQTEVLVTPGLDLALKKMDLMKLLTTESRPRIVHEVRRLLALTMRPGIPLTSAVLALLEKLAIALNPDCMPFDIWHQRSVEALPFSCTVEP